MRGYKQPTVSVIGASGYSGAELTKILARHPSVKLDKLYAFSQAGKKTTDLYPWLAVDMTYEAYDGEFDSDICFLALPHGEALKLVPDLRNAGKMVIDLSGDFRLKNAEEHLRFYGREKPDDACMTYAMPELFHEEIRNATAVSNPGCYATSIILGLAPLILKPQDSAKVNTVCCSGISGISGAGKTAKTELSFSEMNDNIRAYKVARHQHTPEILQTLGTSATEPSFGFTFTPMIAPLTRGIYTILNIALDKHLPVSEITELYRSFYISAPFVRVREMPPEILHVAHTNFCDIHVAESGKDGSVVVITAIDNLVKGAAGQAVQNMNIMLGYDEALGLT
ncbi:MAG: N-acetyl-gamma-glutamyl-phosphate reductase [Prosthecochloris sp.]|uniref:N-acetyl-gamma-glutamyl-phosphate reductase n=1 Tax=Prosthecochloris sp. TaxID=290513 RepID=UPI00258D556C|nr:N-acetyl-gamma-glutamyl-phosphate reductase [Prosthecochloris sp.]MCW8797485.1 N-acetyl-gamma-glutamyl-phosphate reductase [Prosthecochloris sp.]